MNMKTEKMKMLIGVLLLPLAYCLWVIDRIIFSVMPQSEHKKLEDWLETKSVIFAITRLLTICLIRYLVILIFGF